jgi:hypothetical protein
MGEAMAWRLVQLADSDAITGDLADAEFLSLYVALRESLRRPYDESNPGFSAYLKLSEIVGSLERSGDFRSHW